MEPRLQDSSKPALLSTPVAGQSELSRPESSQSQPTRSVNTHSSNYCTSSPQFFEGQTQSVPHSSVKKPGRLPTGIFQRVFTEWWMLELFSCGGSLLALLAIVIFLKQREGLGPPEWPYNLTINSAISWLATLMKVFMLVPTAGCISQASWIHFRSKPRALTYMMVHDSASWGPMSSL